VGVTTTEPRAGRNLPAAFAVGGGLAAVVIASLLVWRPAFLAVVVAAVGVATWEMVRAVRVTGARPPLPPLLAGGVAMPVVAWFWGLEALSLGLLGTVLAVLIWRLYEGPTGYQRDVSTATLIAVYVPFLGGFAAMLGAADDGQWRVLVMFAVVVLTDTGGYVAGVFFGRHPMAPTISPKKTWEGLAGSLLAAAAGGAVGLALLLDVDWWWGAVCGLLVAGAAVVGDLAESMLKRDIGIKDMSTLLPGHGGLMDRLDSILFAAPAAYLLLSVLTG
jgi:phosphatidate cytidylyltransferase